MSGLSDKGSQRLTRHWSEALGCDLHQLRDAERRVVVSPDGRVVRLFQWREGWVLTVPPDRCDRARKLCLGRSFREMAAEGDGRYERWFRRGARDHERASHRGLGAYQTLDALAEGLPLRCWSHYLHWYCDSPPPAARALTGQVCRISPENRRLWEQWQSWPGSVCHPRFSERFETADAFGYLLDGRLVSVAQLQDTLGSHAREIGVETLEGFTRRGFATEAARAATQYVLNRAQIAWYYYDHYNLPSSRIPQKLGYGLYAEELVSHLRS